MYYIFPFHLVNPNSKVIIYGAGIAGRNYLNQIKSIAYCEVLCLVDQNYKMISVPGIEVIAPNRISDYEYDFIVISQINDDVREKIKSELVGEYNVDYKKIICTHVRRLEWNQPLQYYESQQEEYLETKHLNDYLAELDAGCLVTSRRIDIGVRYLLFRDFINHVENKKHVSLFSRYILARGGGKELPAYHSG